MMTLGKLAAVSLAVGLVSSASAAIDVCFVPADATFSGPDQTTDVDICADIPEMEAIVGWGLDVIVEDTGVAGVAGVSIGPLFDAAVQNPDGDGLAGLAPLGGNVWGCDVLLATVTYEYHGVGLTITILTDSQPDDLTEGFAIDTDLGGEFATVHYGTGTIFVPEPATLSLLALAAPLAVGRRR
ncbi:MAG: PEP-CTERM sorting domain-containing protein [Phycisphaerae bacterium]|jgi:hypothetical protein